MHTIANSSLQITVNPVGAELCSLKSLSSGLEYMWSGDPSFWSGIAPVLFPIVGGLKSGAYYYNGKAYSLPKHGFIRHNSGLSLLDQSDHAITFELRSNEETLAVYPFQFVFSIRFELADNILTVIHTVTHTGEGDMLFSLGGHPAFACPLHEGEAYTDYYLEFDQSETVHTWDLVPSGEIGKKGRLVLDDEQELSLHEHLFDHDALIFKDLKSRVVHLKSRKSSQVLTVRFEDWPYLGIWAKPKAPYVCIEPWLGIADSADHDQQLANKEGILRLGAGETFEVAYTIEISE